jgi:hypothetical protein
LVLLGPEGKGVNVDTSVRGAGVVLVRLDEVEVSSFTLREAILAVKLELSGDDGVHTPAVEVERSLGKNEGACVRYTRVLVRVVSAKARSKVGLIVATT